MAEKQTEIKLPERPSQSRKQLPNFDVAVPSPPLTKGPLSLSRGPLSPLSLSVPRTIPNASVLCATAIRVGRETRNWLAAAQGERIIRASLFVFPGKIVFLVYYKVYCEKFVISNFLVSRLSWRLTRIFTGYNYTWSVYIYNIHWKSRNDLFLRELLPL